MKHKWPLYLLAFMLLLPASRCEKDNPDPQDQREPLPPATQDGRGTFACYVNDKAFIGRPYNCFFQYDPQNGRYYLSLTGHDKKFKGDIKYPWSIGLDMSHDTWNIPNDTIIPLLVGIDSINSAVGAVHISRTVSDSKFSYTDSTLTGELHITRFDLQEYIVSGTFWFNVLNPYTGDTLHITDGRLDVRISN